MNLIPKQTRHANALANSIVALFDEQDTTTMTKRVCLRAALRQAKDDGCYGEVIELLPEREDIRRQVEYIEDNG